MNCPSSDLWVRWTEGTLPSEIRSRWEGHLSGCPSCQEEMASLLRARPQALSPSQRESWSASSRPRRWSLAAAASLLLLASLVWLLQPSGASRPSSGSGRVGASAPADSAWAQGSGELGASSGFTEALLGRSGSLLLLPGASARVGDREVHLHLGEARLETAGEGIRVRAGGLPGTLEIGEGRLALLVRAPAGTSAWLREALAFEGACLVAVLEGQAVWTDGQERKDLPRGSYLWSGIPEPALWEPGEVLPWREGPPLPDLRDAVAAFEGVPATPYVFEFLLRKREGRADADVLFQAGGRGWRAPLGAHLTGDGSWVRVRLEHGGDRVRLLAGGSLLFSASVHELDDLVHSGEASVPLGVRAWGGDFEFGGLRWRP